MSTSADVMLTRAIYRSLLTAARSLGREHLRLRLPVSESKAQWLRGSQQYGFVPACVSARDIFPHLSADATDVLEPEALRDVIRSEFRRALEKPNLDQGLTALKGLHAQLALAKRSSAVVTEHPETGAAVCIEATSEYITRDGPMYVFQYRIRVSNVGSVPVQIVGRGWDIRNNDGSNHATVPRGSPGVVGQTPRLQPGGDAFEYASGTTFATPGGTIEGTLQCVSLPDGEEQNSFDATVGRFVCLIEDAGS